MAVEEGQLELLTFNLMGVRMAVDLLQVGALMGLEEAEEAGLKVEYLHEKIGFRPEPVTYESPKVLRLKDGAANSGIVIGGMEDIITVGPESVKPFPLFFESLLKSRAFPCAALKDGELILLLDINGLCAPEQGCR